MSLERTAPQVVYVCKRYPELTQTFVTEELAAVRDLGWRPMVYSQRLPLVHGEATRDVPHRCLEGSITASAAVFYVVLALMRFPIRIWRLISYLRTAPVRSRRRRFVEAAIIAVRHAGSRPARVHAHFASQPATTAMLAAWMLDVDFSFTAHAVDIFAEDEDVATKLRAADVCITVCDYNAEYIARRWNHPRESIAVVPCGVDPESFQRATPYSSGPFRIIAIGRLVEKKGFDVLIEACAVLRDQGSEFECTIVGDGPLRLELESLVGDRRLADRVQLVGALEHDLVRSRLEEASVLCLPCRIADDGDRDSQPVVIKEAMAMEVPVVATQGLGIPEVVDRACGRLVPMDDAPALAYALGELLDMPEGELRFMGRRGRERVESSFSLDETVPRLIDAWEGARP